MLIGLVDASVQSLARRPLGPEEDQAVQQELLPPILPVLHPRPCCSSPCSVLGADAIAKLNCSILDMLLESIIALPGFAMYVPPFHSLTSTSPDDVPNHAVLSPACS
jgi:hypothetical protein